MATMTMTSTTHDTWGLLTLDGELDLSTSPELSEALLALGTDHPRIAIDLRSVTFMDSTALGVLVSTRQRSEIAGGELILHGVQPAQMKVFEVTGLADSMNFDGDGDVPQELVDAAHQELEYPADETNEG